MAALDTYRTLIPAHADDTVFTDAYVTEMLTLASQMMDPIVFGLVYEKAMVYLAAHFVELDPAVAGSRTATETGVLTAQGDHSLNRQYAQPPMGMAEADMYLETTQYGQRFKLLRDTRARVAPVVVI